MFKIFALSLHLGVCVCVCSHICGGHLQRSEEGVNSPGTNVIIAM